MPSQKAEKIDIHAEYPCPCRRRGRLSNIILTEAFGCNKCQQIFVVQENGEAIEQLSTNYPYKRTWCWTGREWMKIPSGFGEYYGSVALFMLFFMVVICVSLVFLFSGANIWLSVMMLSLVVLLLSIVMQWLARGRSSR